MQPSMYIALMLLTGAASIEEVLLFPAHAFLAQDG